MKTVSEKKIKIERVRKRQREREREEERECGKEMERERVGEIQKENIMKTWAGKGGEREKRESDEEMECEMELRKHTNDKPTFSFHLRLKGKPEIPVLRSSINY